MSKKFQTLMNAVDEDLLEEAITPVKKKKSLAWVGVAVAASLLLTIGLIRFPSSAPVITVAELSDMGYDIRLPEEAEKVRYEIVSLQEQEAARASFMTQDTKYVYQAVKTDAPQNLSGEGILTWNTGDMDIQLLSSGSNTSVSWYRQEEQTQWYLTADADSAVVLTTASQILRAIGLDVTVAPKNAQNVTYNAFILDGMTVAETTFQINGITCSYRMAGTLELMEDIADISGLDESFEHRAEGKVYWCSAKLSYNEGGQGKILWFDVAPGILYSMSMDSGASEEALLEMANSLFEPAQNDIG